jgi:uncharacterized protein (TIGR04552 family)
MPTSFVRDLSPNEKAMLKHILSGHSIIDWPRLYFRNPEDVKSFLKVNEFDLSRQRDVDRLMSIHNEAAGYLRRELGYALSEELLRPERLLDLFLVASDPRNPPLQSQALSLLKTMNIINHIDGRELLYNCPISVRDLFSLVEDKVERALSALSRKESYLLKYQGGRKPKESVVTKLLCKRETIAAQVYDRVRYRIVTRTKEDILRAILYLFQSILPFNYLIPGASMNQLIFLDWSDRFSASLRRLKNLLPSPAMEYSGRNYRVCKFVVDIPVRMDNFLATTAGPVYRESLGTIVFVLVEFQIIDEETEILNNSGESSHENYKKRQKDGVRKRLVGG